MFTPDLLNNDYCLKKIVLILTWVYKTLQRELAPFAKIPDFNERLLITMDYETGSHNGIKQLNAIDWLLTIEE